VAEQTPVVIKNGQLEQLQPGDTLVMVPGDQYLDVNRTLLTVAGTIVYIGDGDVLFKASP
jgi:hypothetical protein